MREMHMQSRKAMASAGLALAVTVTVAAAVFQGALAGAITAAWALGVLGLFRFGTGRSETVRTMSGAGDERTRSLNVRALAFGGFVMWAASTGWWIVSSIAGEENVTAGALAATFAVAYIGAAAYVSRRG